jgi:hypothetical protein
MNNPKDPKPPNPSPKPGSWGVNKLNFSTKQQIQPKMTQQPRAQWICIDHEGQYASFDTDSELREHLFAIKKEYLNDLFNSSTSIEELCRQATSNHVVSIILKASVSQLYSIQ